MRYWKWTVLAAAWLGAVGTGLWAMFEYETTPGTAAASPMHWPAGSALPMDRELSTVVIFLHPHCPCSRASLHELLVLATHCGGQMKTIAVFLKPKGFEPDWEKTDLWQAARLIPGAACFTDNEGKETARFGAQVSGETLIYDTSGTLVFHGGITASRGHQGDNAGRFAVEAILRGERPAVRQTPIFGCSLRERTGSITTGPSPVREVL